ncbi:hypothetical protein U1Q18_031457 [Sarracenia purpurea var. burkii]
MESDLVLPDGGNSESREDRVLETAASIRASWRKADGMRETPVPSLLMCHKGGRELTVGGQGRRIYLPSSLLVPLPSSYFLSANPTVKERNGLRRSGWRSQPRKERNKRVHWSRFPPSSYTVA